MVKRKENGNPLEDYVDEHCVLKHATAKAYLIDFGNMETWLPKSYSIVEDNGYAGEVKVTIPMWLAERKGLV